MPECQSEASFSGIRYPNAPWGGTGYSNQTALFAPKLAETYALGISAFWGLEGAVIPWNGIPVFPGLGSSYGDLTIEEHAKVHFDGDLRGGLTFTLLDVWALDPKVWRGLNVCSWVPIDHRPAPGPVLRFFDEAAAVPLAMSKFGEEQLQNASLDPLYCPHAVDAKTYRPLPKQESREATHIPQDAFVVGMVAANKGNPSRKAFAESFQAFKALHDRHPEARLYVHTEFTGRFGGVDLPALMHMVGIDPQTVLFADQYRMAHHPFAASRMAQVYSSMDVLLAASCGEGFGIPVIEAQACSVPVIVSDFSAQPELCGAGWTVSGRTVYTPLKAFQFLPDVEDILEALEAVYRLPKAGWDECATKARAHAEQYHVDHVLETFMLPALEQARERFDDRKPVDVVARARRKHGHKKVAA